MNAINMPKVTVYSEGGCCNMYSNVSSPVDLIDGSTLCASMALTGCSQLIFSPYLTAKRLIAAVNASAKIIPSVICSQGLGRFNRKVRCPSLYIISRV